MSAEGWMNNISFIVNYVLMISFSEFERISSVDVIIDKEEVKYSFVNICSMK